MRTEHYKCPTEFQDRITRAGGLNRYGQPNFIIVWGQSWTVRRGGIWNNADGSYFRGYCDVVEDGRPCWVLKQWNPPEFYGSSTLWFMENRDENTGMQLLGDFPWRGQYETIQPFVWRGLVNDKLVVEHMPLNSMMIDLVIPIIMQCKDASMTKKKLALEAKQEQEDKKQLRAVEARRHNANMAFRGKPVSFAGQRMRTPLVCHKMYQIEKSMNRAMNLMKNSGLGISLH